MGGLQTSGRIYIETSSNQILAGYYNGGWRSAVLVPSISTNTEYWLHIKYSNSTGRLFTEYSTDGSTYTQAANDSFSMVFATNLGLYLGTNLEDSQAINVWSGKIYLQDCKMYLDNKEWWSGVGHTDKRFALQEIVVHPEDFENVASDFVQPILSENGTIGGSSFAVASDSYHSVYYAWRAFNGDASDMWHSSAGYPHWIEFYNPEELLVKEISFCNGPNPIGILPIGHFEIQYSYDGSNWNKVYEADNNVTDATTRIVADLSNNTIAAKYWRIWSNTQNPSSVNKAYCQINEVRIVDKAGSSKLGYLSLANPQGNTKVIATGMRNPTKEYAGSVSTPADLAKKITFSEDFSTITSLEDI